MSNVTPSQVAPIAVTQSNGLPLIFRSNSESQPEIVLVGSDGSTSTIELSAALGLVSGEYVTAFDVKQTADFRIYLVIATGYLTSKNASRLFVLRPFRPQDIEISSVEAIRALVVPQTKEIPGTIQRVLIVSEAINIFSHILTHH